jgi:hypothetical protein
MDSTLLLWIFLGVWIALVLLYILFKLCGGRFADCFSCDCFSGPCCDCWGASGQVDEFDREYPFARDLWPPGRQGPSLPPIVIVNDFDDDKREGGGGRGNGRYSRVDDADDIEYRDGVDGEIESDSDRFVRSEEADGAANETLLLRSSSEDASFDRRESRPDSVTVV